MATSTALAVTAVLLQIVATIIKFVHLAKPGEDADNGPEPKPTW